MYIEKVRLTNIRCFKDITLDLSSAKGVKKWAVIVGDNGAGKTTLLQSIAIGLCDKDGASGLLRDMGSDLIGDIEKPANITIDIRKGRDKFYTFKTTLRRSRTGIEVIYAKTTKRPEEFRREKFFVCGYGPNRGIGGDDEPAQRYTIADAVYTIINYDWYLLNPELMFWRITKGNRRLIKRVSNWLNFILMLPKGDTVDLTQMGIIIRRACGHEIPISACGDGYGASVTWILDMLARFLHANSWKKEIPTETSFSGIIILDEIEQHLHPKWQREIIYRLSRQFQNIQFIVTTHSPLCAAGTEDVANGNSLLILLEQDEKGQTKLIVDLPSVAGMRPDQVLASRVFGYLIKASPHIEEILHRASILAGKGKKRTTKENLEYKKITSQMKSIVLSNEHTLFEQELIQQHDQATRNKINTLEKKLFGESNDKH